MGHAFGALLVPYLLLSLLRIFQMNYHHGPFIVLLPLLAAVGRGYLRSVRRHVFRQT